MDKLCRAEKIAFFSAHTFGMDGVVMLDLGEHTYRRSVTGENAAAPEPQQVAFPSLQESYEVKWSSLKSGRKRGPQIPRVYVKYQCEFGFSYHETL